MNAASPREEGPDACAAVRDDLHRRAVQRLQRLPLQRLAYEPVGEGCAVSQEQGAIGVAERLVRVVGSEDDAEPLRRQSADLSHDLALVAEVEARGRFVENDEAG